MRIGELIVRRARWLFGLWWLHVWLLHYFFIGFISFDGFNYRGVPIVELAQHASLGTARYLDWPRVGYFPFVELAHLPFVFLLGLRGFLVGFPLLVFPLCVIAVYRLIAELTASKESAVYGAFAYCALPLVNEQPFSGYIDFAVAGILAYFLFAAIRWKSQAGLRPALRIAVAACLLGMARPQGLYLGICLLPILAVAMFCERTGWRLRVTAPRKIVLLCIAFFLGSIPAIALQIYKYRTYGSPIAPFQLHILGLDIGTGMPMTKVFQDSGLGDGSFGELARGFVRGWIWGGTGRIGGFYDSRNQGGGFLLPLALLLVPTFARSATRVERWIVVGGIAISFLAKDFGLPRYGYTTMISIAIIFGRAVPRLATKRAAFLFVITILSLHLLRPEVDLLQLRRGLLSPRLDLAETSLYVTSRESLVVYPSRGDRFVIVDTIDMTLLVFGRDLSNEVLGSIAGADLGIQCNHLRPYLEAEPRALVIDQHDLTKDCRRECMIFNESSCAAWKIEPGP